MCREDIKDYLGNYCKRLGIKGEKWKGFFSGISIKIRWLFVIEEIKLILKF